MTLDRHFLTAHTALLFALFGLSQGSTRTCKTAMSAIGEAYGMITAMLKVIYRINHTLNLRLLCYDIYINKFFNA